MLEDALSELRSVTARFDDAGKAERTVAWLLNIGLQPSQIRQFQDQASEPSRPAETTPFPAPKRRRSFVDSLVDFVMPDEEAKAAKGSLGKGPRNVTVSNIAPAMYNRVVAILNEEGKVKVEPPKPEVVAPIIFPPQDAPLVETISIKAEDPKVTVEAPEPEVPAPAHRKSMPAPSTDLAEANGIKGFIGACLVDSDSGLMLASEGGGRLDLEVVAALNSDSVRAKQHAVKQFGLNEKIQEILITLDNQVHLIRPLESAPSMFVYLALEKASSNLGMARIQLKHIEANMKL